MGKKETKLFADKLDTLPVTKSEIGNETIIEKTQNELTAKKWKFDNENGYIWAMISMALHRAGELEVPPTEYMTATEYSYIFLNDNKIYKILEEVRNKLQMYEFTDLMAHLTTNN